MQMKTLEMTTDKEDKTFENCKNAIINRR